MSKKGIETYTNLVALVQRDRKGAHAADVELKVLTSIWQMLRGGNIWSGVGEDGEQEPKPTVYANFACI